MDHTVRVLVVEPSVTVRSFLARELAKDPAIEVVGTAANPLQACEMILKTRPCALAWDLDASNLVGMDGVNQLLSKYVLPVVVFGAAADQNHRMAITKTAAAKVQFVTKDPGDGTKAIAGRVDEVRKALVSVAKSPTKTTLLTGGQSCANKQPPLAMPPAARRNLIAIGASTGGTNAVATILRRLPRECPGVVIVQHMPAGFTELFAGRLDTECHMDVKEAEHGDKIVPGRALVAPGGRQLEVVKIGGGYAVNVRAGPPVCGHCPSVDVMMRSVARVAGKDAVGVMLTGMGSDGADAMRLMRDAGARCVAQDEATSVVFGMPKEAHLRGGAERLVPIQSMASQILALL